MIYNATPAGGGISDIHLGLILETSINELEFHKQQ
jgi:hypothetical protein